MRPPLFGCRVFALTGGEPFVHPDFSHIVDHLLSYDNSHVVVLTNGLLLQQTAQAIAKWPSARFHLQISLDGNPEHHDQIRGPGAYKALTSQLAWLHRRQYPFTLSMCVNANNVGDMPALVELAHQYGGSNVHFLWYFVRGRGEAASFAPPEKILPHLIQAGERAAQSGPYPGQPGKSAQPGFCAQRHHPRRPRQWLGFPGHRPGRPDLPLPCPGRPA